MTLVLTLAASPLWQAVTANQTLPKVATFAQAIEHTPEQTQAVWVTDGVSQADLATMVTKCTHLFVVYDAPSSALAALLQAKVPLEHALPQVQDAFTTLLSWQRQHRRKVSLVCLQHVAYCTAAELTDAEALLLSHNVTLTLPFTASGLTPTVDLYELAANQLMLQQPDFAALADVLHASSLPLGVNGVAFNVANVIQQITLQQQQHEATHESLQLAQAQNSQLQHMLQQITHTNTQQTALITQLQQTQQQLNEHNEQVTTRCEQAQQDNEQLLTQLLQVQEALEQQYLDKQDLAQKLQQRQQEIAALNAAQTALAKESTALSQQYQQQLAQLKAQLHSQHQQQLTTLQQELTALNQTHTQECTALQQRVTVLTNQLKQAEQGAATQLAAHSVALQEAQTEGQQLLTQLMAVQEELERYYVQWQQQCQQLKQQEQYAMQQQQQLQQQIHHLEQEKQRQHTLAVQQQKQQQRELTKLSQQHNKQRAELAGYKYHYEQLRQQLHAMQGSTSWKVAAPIRVLSRAIKKTDKAKLRLQQDIGLLFTSELFDADWYLATYPDLQEAGVNPAEHYLQYGAAEGRFPSAEFDGNWYLQRYPDVAESGVNPLLHYIKFGRNEGRTASPKLLENHSDSKQG